MSNALSTGLCQQRLSVLETLREDYALLALGPPEHGCTLELCGECPTCQSYMDMREEIEYEIRMVQEELAPILAAQAKMRTAYICKDMVRPLVTPLDDRIVALALLINGQRETAAGVR